MSRTVTGTLLLPNGQPMANARIFFTAKRTEAISIVEGVNAFFDTNGSGAYNQEIVDGWYGVSIEWQADSAGATVRRWQLGNAVVEAGASTTLEALIIASNPVASVETTLLYEVLEQAQQARDDAEAAADAAAASAATISPTKQAQWDQAYSERNRWDGGSAGLNAATGRASLSLGTASQANLVTSSTDTTAGRATTVGWMGLGGNGVNVSFANNDFSSLIATGMGAPNATYSVGLHIRGTANTAGNIAIRNNSMYHQSLESGVLGDWLRVWDDANLVKTTSATDITTERVPVSGWLGNGRALAYKSQATDDLNDFNVAGAHGLWGGNSLNRPTNNVYVVHVLGGSPSSSEGQIPSRIVQVAYQVGGAASYRRSYNGSSWGAWQEEWNTGNTSADVQTMLGSANNSAIRSAISASSLPPYTLVTVPSAAANTNLLIVITDLTGGREPCFSDGTGWRRCSDKTTAN